MFGPMEGASGCCQDVKQVGEFLRAALEASAAADESGRTRHWQLLASDENGVKLGGVTVDYIQTA